MYHVFHLEKIHICSPFSKQNNFTPSFEIFFFFKWDLI